MKKFTYLLFGILIMPFMTACAPKMCTKLAEFPLMYEENPASILILPPINESTAADAKEYYSTTIQEPLVFSGTVVVDLSGGNTGRGVAGLIAKAIITAVSSAMADYVPYAQQANYRALSTMPYGKYHAQHNKDQQVQFVDQTPESNTTE